MTISPWLRIMIRVRVGRPGMGPNSLTRAESHLQLAIVCCTHGAEF